MPRCSRVPVLLPSPARPRDRSRSPTAPRKSWTRLSQPSLPSGPSGPPHHRTGLPSAPSIWKASRPETRPSKRTLQPGRSGTIAHLQTCRLLATRADDVIGWAALSPVSSRCVYEGVAEVSVYVAGRARGQGVGTALLNGLIRRVGTGRPLDARVRDLPRKRRQPRASQGMRLSGSRPPRASGQDERPVARRRAARAAQPGRGLDATRVIGAAGRR